MHVDVNVNTLAATGTYRYPRRHRVDRWELDQWHEPEMRRYVADLAQHARTMQRLMFTNSWTDVHNMLCHLLVQVNELERIVKSSFDQLHSDYAWRIHEFKELHGNLLSNIEKAEERNAELTAKIAQLNHEVAQLKLQGGIAQVMNHQRVNIAWQRMASRLLESKVAELDDADSE